MLSVSGLVFSYVFLSVAHPYRGSSSLYAITQVPHNVSPGWSQGYHHRPGVGTPVKSSWGSSPSRPQNTDLTVTTWSWLPTTTKSPSDRIFPSEALDTQFRGQPPKQNSVSSTSGCKVGDKVYKVGDKWTAEGGCGRHSCVEGGKTTILGCPSIEAAENCTVKPEDPRQPWPVCCSQLQCQ